MTQQDDKYMDDISLLNFQHKLFRHTQIDRATLNYNKYTLYLKILLIYLFHRHVSDLVSGGNTRPGNVADVHAFWPCIKDQLTWHEQERFSMLRKVHTDYGRGRAWLRAVLNERSLERHLHAIINPNTLSPFYEEWAFLLDQEKSSVLPNVAAGIYF